jgi:glutamate racemase
VAAFLGCTHYGYQTETFERELRRQVGEVRILNPNRRAGRTIVERIHAAAGAGAGSAAPVTIRFVSRYAVPAPPLRSLPRYLGAGAPATVAALLDFEHDVFFHGARSGG